MYQFWRFWPVLLQSWNESMWNATRLRYVFRGSSRSWICPGPRVQLIRPCSWVMNYNAHELMLLTLCTNFQVFAHFALQSSPMKLYFRYLSCEHFPDITNIFCLLPSHFTSTLSVPHGPLSGPFFHLKHFEASASLCVVNGILLDIGLNLWHSQYSNRKSVISPAH